MKTRNEFNFKNYINRRKKFLHHNKKKSFVFLEGEGKIMFSVPHAVRQVRLGVGKVSEPNTLSLALEVREKVKVPMIVKTACMNDDANFDILCPYKYDLVDYIKAHDIKYLIDIHSLASTREQDINFGVNFGMNIAPDEKFFDFVYNNFKKEGFNVFVDQPFCANGNTIAAYVSKQCGIWTMQLEVNSKFLLKQENVDSLLKIVNVLVLAVEKANTEPVKKTKEGK